MMRSMFAACVMVSSLLAAAARAQGFDPQRSFPGESAAPRVERVSKTAPSPVEVKLQWSADDAKPGDQRVLAVVLSFAPKYHINPNAAQLPSDKPYLIATELSVEAAPQGLRIGAPQFPKADEITVTYSSKPFQQAVYHLNPTPILIPVQVNPDATMGSHVVKLKLTYQACDDKQCLPPRDVELEAALSIKPDAPAAPPPDPAIFGAFDATVFADLATGGSANLPGGNLPTDLQPVSLDFFGHKVTIDPSHGLGLTALVAMAALGGFLLNLTPCVLPVIPLKVLGLSRAAGNRVRCLLLGGAMSLGVVFFWMLLGIVISRVSGFTSANQLFQYPAFTIAIGVVIAAMAVGMCGLFTLQLPAWVYNLNPRQETLLGSIGFGVLTAVLSTPCTAPFMGGAAAWAVTQPAAVTLTVFAAIGVGMAMPYFLLSAFPSLLAVVPRSGPGSELVKQVMGIAMLATAAYFAGIGVVTLMTEPPDAPSKAYWWPVMTLVGVAGVWLAVRALKVFSSRTARIVFVMLGLVIFGVASVLGPSLTSPGPIAWVNYTPERYRRAIADGKAVMLDFTAEWCLNCKVLESTVLHDPRVLAALGDGYAGTQVVPMRVDITQRANIDGTAKLREVGRVAIPALVVVTPRGEEVLNADNYTPDQVVSALTKARGSK